MSCTSFMEVPRFTEADFKSQASNVRVSREMLHRRLVLELRMKDMVMRLLLFVGYLAPFLCMLHGIWPPDQISLVHRRLETAFGMDAIENVRTADDIYTFLQEFAATNAQLQASSPQYWCSEDSFSLEWDLDLLQTRRVCQEVATSPTTTTVASTTGASVVGPSVGPVVADATSTTTPLPPRHHRLRKFTSPQLTLLPAVVYQSRFAATTCTGYAQMYEEQGTNPANAYAPALDGVKHGSLTTCVDRQTSLDDDFALQVPCPPDDEIDSRCPNGTYPFTSRYAREGGVTVYPEVLSQPEVDLARLRAVQWLDTQTDTARVSTLVYTEGLEIFSVVSVDFSFDLAGGVVPTVRTQSWKDLMGDDKDNFLAAGVIAIIVSVAGLAHTMYLLNGEGRETPVRDPLSGSLATLFRLEGMSALTIIEIITRLPVLVMSLVMVIGGTGANSLAAKFDSAVAAAAAGDGMLGAYFDAADEIDGHLGFLDMAHVFCFIAVSLQIFQLMSYFHVHPGMASFSSTAMRAMSSIVHFLALFVLLFLLSTFLVHWMFGDELAAFSTLGRSLTSQMQMIYGHFLYTPEAAALDSDTANMYWIYALTFAVVMFFVLLDLFVAVIVDAFGELKEESRGKEVARTFVMDVVDAILTPRMYGSNGFPPALELLEWLECRGDAPHAPHTKHLTLSNLRSRFEAEPQAGKPDPAKVFLAHYGNKIPNLVWFASEDEIAEEVQPQASSPTVPETNGLDDAPQRLARMAMKEIASQLADKKLSGPQVYQEVDWFMIASKLSCSFYKEFREMGLITDEVSKRK